MNLPMEWLDSFVAVKDLDIKQFCDRMTATGSKVEGFETLGGEVSNVVAGRILSVEPHPDADRLVICQVDVGDDAPLQIVTAAKNVYAGALVPVAKAPAKLPGGVKIQAGKLRGAVSGGMFCSIEELQLTLHDMPYAVEDGILLLNEDPTLADCLPAPGEDVLAALGLRDQVVEFEITPNRPDCLSVIGLARETGASFDRALHIPAPAVRGCGGDIHAYLTDVTVKNSELCPRYTARVVKNVRIAPSPLWMRRRLRAAGVRPINNIVDITNYVMLEYGQPMHAFDYACLEGKRIVVREAADAETFRSLDQADHTLRAGMLVISDEVKAVALAGVMGGANSEISESTNTVVLESACFLGSSVRTTSRALGMRTESSGRFEKGLDPENTLPAVQRACELIEMLGAGEIVDGVIDVYGRRPEPVSLKLDPARINRFLGTDIPAEEMRRILRNLHFVLDADDTVHVPSYRADVATMNDLAEEVIRIYGYDTIVSTGFRANVKTGEYSPRKAYTLRLNRLLCALGGYEICAFSFISPRYYDKIGMAKEDPRRRSVVISNPLGEDTSVMRSVLLPSVMESLARNHNYHSEAVTLFETAPVYLPADDPKKQPSEPVKTAIAGYGMDFYDMKGICEAVLTDAGLQNFRCEACTDHPTFHPGRAAKLLTPDGVCLGLFGELHPDVAAAYGFDDDCRVQAAELDTELIFSRSCFDKQYVPLPRYPAVTRDFAFLCEDTLTAGAVEDVMRRAGGKLLESVSVFDVYRGEKLGEGRKSMAFTVSLRAPDHTLTDAEAGEVAAKILNAVEKELGLTLRG